MIQKNALRQLWIYALALLIFVIDISAAALLEQQFMYGLLCFIVFWLFMPSSTLFISFLLFLFLLEQFLILGHCGLPLLYLIPAIIIAFKSRHLFHSNLLTAYLLVTACLLAQFLLLEPYLFHVKPQFFYTIGKILVNIIVMILFSLKCRSTVS